MRIPRIYTELMLASGSEADLDEAASHHILKVLRMDVGRPLILFNGQGGQYSAEIIAKTKKIARVSVTGFDAADKASPLRTHIAIGISRGERFEWVLQKATELGVSEITPLFAQRGEVKLSGERLAKKAQSWQKIIIAACEQSGLNILPILKPAMRLDDFLKQDLPSAKFVLHHRQAQRFADCKPCNDVTMMIGPEGGLTEEEIASAQDTGFQALTLGPRVLRTETAPIVALSLMQAAWGDF